MVYSQRYAITQFTVFYDWHFSVSIFSSFICVVALYTEFLKWSIHPSTHWNLASKSITLLKCVGYKWFLIIQSSSHFSGFTLTSFSTNMGWVLTECQFPWASLTSFSLTCPFLRFHTSCSFSCFPVWAISVCFFHSPFPSPRLVVGICPLLWHSSSGISRLVFSTIRLSIW